MRKCIGLITGLLIASAGPAAAQNSLADALALAYETNPELAAQIAALRATNEGVPLALSGFRPTIEAFGSAGVEWQNVDPEPLSDPDELTTPGSIGITLSQPIFTAGRVDADVSSAENTVLSSRATLLIIEQSVLLAAATAFMDVVEAQAVLELNINNEDVLQRQLDATQDRFAVGELTRTDVSQAESRLAGAVADRIGAEGSLRTVRAEFERVIGMPPGLLLAPQPLQGLPTSLDETVALAEQNDPAILQAVFAQRAAEDDIDVARSELYPTLSLEGSVSRSFEPSAGIDTTDVATVTAQLRVPLYQSGAEYARIRQARELASQARIDIETSRRQAIETAVTAWEALTTARATIESFLSQVRSAEIALDGVQQEAQVGSRTVLDVLDAEQELLDARVSLVRSQRDEVVAGFAVLSAVGQLTARDLGLPVEYYNVEADYDAVRDALIGTGIEGR